jgi:hypothetical protein
MQNDIEKNYNGPIMVIGYRGYPINGFCYDIIQNGEIKSRLNTSHSDVLHRAYSLALEDFKIAMESDGKLYTIEKYTGTLEAYANAKYFKNPIKRILYQWYLFLGKFFK